MLSLSPVKLNLNIYPHLNFNQLSDTVLIFGNTLCAILPWKIIICVMLGFVSAYLHMMKDCMKYKTKLKNLWKWFEKYKKKSKHARVRSVPSGHICKFICGFGWNKVKAGDHSFRVLLWFLAALTLHEMNLEMNQIRICPSPRALLCLYHPPQWSPHCPRLRKC